MSLSRANLIWIALLTSGCGAHNPLYHPPVTQIVVADPTPRAVPAAKIVPTAGPFVETEPCSAQFRKLIENLSKSQLQGTNLFRALAESSQCSAALDSIARTLNENSGTICNVTGQDIVKGQDILLLNECVMAATAALGSDAVVRALGLKPSTSPNDSPSDSDRFQLQGSATDKLSSFVLSTSNSLPSTVVTPGAPSSATFISGLADFLVTRAQEEVVEDLAQRFAGLFCTKEWDGVAVDTYFSRTCNLLTGKYHDLQRSEVSLRDFGSALQSALQDDVLGLLPVLLNAAHAGLASYPEMTVIANSLPSLLKRDYITFFTGLISTAACSPAEKGKSYTQDIEIVCALQTVAEAWIALDKSPDKSPDAIFNIVNQKIAQNSVLSSWIADRLPEDRFRGVFDEVRELRALVQDAERSKRIDATEFIQRIVAVLHHRIYNSAVIVAIEAHLGPVRELVDRVSSLAYIAFDVSRAALLGKDPFRVIVADAQQLECSSASSGTPSDVACAIALSGVVVSVLLETRAKGIDTSKPAANYLEDVAQRVERAVKYRTDGLPAWIEGVFGVIGKKVISVHTKKNLQSFETDLFQAIRGLAATLRPDESDGSTSATTRVDKQILAVGTLLKVIIEDVLDDSACAKRAISILDNSVTLALSVYHRELAKFVAALFALASDLGMPEPVPPRLRQYVPLATALASATTAEQVKAAFEKYGADPSAYQTKRQAGHHVSLSGFVGGAVGAERGFGGTPGTATTAELFIPVGIDIAWGGCRACGLFAGILDLGSVTSLHITSDTVETSKNPTFAQVLSPGLYYRQGITGPYTMGVGASIAPGVRQDDMGNKASVWRAMVFFGVDVTILGL